MLTNLMKWMRLSRGAASTSTRAIAAGNILRGCYHEIMPYILYVTRLNINFALAIDADAWTDADEIFSLQLYIDFFPSFCNRVDMCAPQANIITRNNRRIYVRMRVSNYMWRVISSSLQNDSRHQIQTLTCMAGFTYSLGWDGLGWVGSQFFGGK
jgi:hypothetical protein